MVAVRHLNSAPITEALLDFRVQPKPDIQFPVDQLDQLAQQIADTYPNVEQKRFRKLEMELGPTGMAARTHEPGVQAYWFRTEKEDRIAQFRVDGFTYNVLKPYDTWETMQLEALRLWRLYEDIMQPQALIRLGSRFINHVDLEMPVDWGEHLTDVPFGVENLPGEVLNFMDRAMLHGQDGITANVVVASDDTIKNNITILADIDVFQLAELPAPVDLGTLDSTLSQFRQFKNDIFFSIFTERTIKLYE